MVSVDGVGGGGGGGGERERERERERENRNMVLLYSEKAEHHSVTLLNGTGSCRQCLKNTQTQK